VRHQVEPFGHLLIVFSAVLVLFEETQKFSRAEANRILDLSFLLLNVLNEVRERKPLVLVGGDRQPIESSGYYGGGCFDSMTVNGACEGDGFGFSVFDALA